MEHDKDFAETAMNDILGWYGYGDSVDHRLDNTAAPPSASSNATAGESGAQQRTNGNKERSSLSPSSVSQTVSSSGVVVATSKSKHNKTQHHKPRQFNMLQHNSSELSDTVIASAAAAAAAAVVVASGVVSPSSLGKATNSCTTTSSAGIGGGNANKATANSSSGGSTNNCNNTRNGVNLHHHGESSTSEKDSSRESSKSPMLVKMLDKQEPTCQWCRRGVPPGQNGILGTTEGTIFCSESCFSQSRRASFKRAKTCDWCRHVRHAVSYVDFQDGVTQLQFCSDKCLNQYKMQIFCNETQAHLDMNPHLKEKSASTGSLITPDLWLKNCKSRSVSPTSERSESVSPAPSITMRPSPEHSPAMHSPPAKKPMISVAPASKLLSKPAQVSIVRSSSKVNRKRRPGLRPIQHPVLQSRRNSTPKIDFSQTNNNNSNVLNNNLASACSNTLSKPATVTSSGVQDLRTVIPMQNLQHPLTPTKFENRESPNAPRPSLNIPHQFLQIPPNPAMRPPFFPMNPMFRFGNPNTMPPPPPVGTPMPNYDHAASNRPPGSILGLPVPPVTILVPCPIVIPLPLPIPIPIPLIDFLKATNPKSPKLEPSTSQTPDNQPEDISDPEQEPEAEESPLDFTIAGHGHRRQQEQEEELMSAGRNSYTLESAHGAGDTRANKTENSPEHKLPKFKITRLNMRRVEEGDEGDKQPTVVRIREQRPAEEEPDEMCTELVERSRPLRKRKRLVVAHHEAMAAEQDEESGGAKG
ncbi:sine oculis-binding protein homolog isoform X2 [Armigeres subalbatus]|uniref:sine oculis-binding protein homolog isoform X2 n=1 Tax=Armigeres subalbatus TaxID=124917 RepID=UPI002ED33856